MDPTAPQQLGKYQIKGILGRGAMGVVYEGFDPTIRRRVAIKTIKTELLDQSERDQILGRFQREAQAAGNINHPDIITIYDYGEDNGIAFIAMEFVSGRELKELLDNDERLSVEQSAKMMKKLLSALGYAHKKGVVHRDMKPGNILLVDGDLDTIKIMDFGIAQVESSTMTQVGTVLGTPSYMSPEQFMGQRVDARSDIYSMGVIFYQLLTGEKPFTGSVTTIMHKVLQADAIPPSTINVQCPGAFDTVVAKAMAKKPEDRFASVQEFAQAIDIAMVGPLKTDQTLSLDDEEEREITAVMGERRVAEAMQRNRAKARRPLFAGAAAAVLLLLAVGWWLTSGTPSGGGSPAGTDGSGGSGPVVSSEIVSTIESDPAGRQTGDEVATEGASGGVPVVDTGPGSGYVEIRTDPTGAKISYAAGKTLGTAPVAVDLQQGEYDLLLSLPGYENLIWNLTIEPGVDTEVEISMVRAAQP